MVSQRFAVERQLPILQTDLPLPTSLDGQPIYCYGAYLLICKFTDDWGQIRKQNLTFYAVDKEGPELLLGMPALKECKVRIDCDTSMWRFGVVKHAISIERPEEFKRTLSTEAAVYALVVSGEAVPYAHPSRDVTTTNPESPMLPEYLQDYTSVFSSEGAGRLAPHKGHDHAIELEGGEPPYGPLYNLSTTELAVLRRYLDDALAKG